MSCERGWSGRESGSARLWRKKLTDEEFDELGKQAMAVELGPVSAATWETIRPVRWSWIPTVGEILACGAVAAIALFVIGSRLERTRPVQEIPVIQQAMRDETRGVLAS